MKIKNISVKPICIGDVSLGSPARPHRSRPSTPMLWRSTSAWAMCRKSWRRRPVAKAKTPDAEPDAIAEDAAEEES